MIPPILHQTWKNKDVPEQWQGSYKSCQKELAAFERKLWTDAEMEEFVKVNYPDMYETYMGYPHHIQRCDSFRYMLLYKVGGVYLDLDTVCRQSITPLLNYDVVLARSPNMGKYVTNSLLMTAPGHPFFRYVIEQLKNYKDSYGWFSKHFHVLNSTGPIFFTNVYHSYVKLNGPIPNSYVLTKEEFSGNCSVCSDTCSGGTYFSHVVGRSWNSWDSQFFNYFLCNWKMSVLILLVLVAAAVYYLKRRR